MRKKAFTWLFIFPPYGIYILYKHKILNPIITTIITIIIALIIGVAIDTAINPYGRYDKMANNAIIEFNIKNENKLGDIRFTEKEDDLISVKDTTYLKYGIYTNEGKYYAYLKPSEKQLELSGIYKIEPERTPIYGENILPTYVSKVFPEITLFLEENRDKYGEFESLKENLDSETQIVKTTKGTYKIEVKYEQVTKIYMLGPNNEGELVYNNNPQIKLNPKIVKGLKKYKGAGKIERVLDQENLDNKRSQMVETTNGIFVVDIYDDGTIKILKGKIKE